MLKKIRLSVFSVLFITGFFSLFLDAGTSQETPSDTPPVYVMTIDGAIGPAMSGYLDSTIRIAHENNAQLVVVKLDTPGGLLTTTREMVSSIIESPVPIAVWVAPSGAHAASAGTFLLYAAHIAAMDEGTNVGAATPVEMRGQIDQPSETSPEEEILQDSTNAFEKMKEVLDKTAEDKKDGNAEALSNKAMEDTKAFIRGIAEMRGRNIDWAEQAVEDAKSITAKEALELGVIDVVATSLNGLLEYADGKAVEVKNKGALLLNTAEADVVMLDPDWKTTFLTLITDPNIAMILMSLGVYGLILEFYNPGALVPGTVGIISLIIGLFALNILPVNAAGAALMVLGIIFMIAEFFIPSFGVIGIGGVGAFILGGAMMFESEYMPGLSLNYEVLLGIGLLGLITMMILVFVTAKAYRQKDQTGVESMENTLAEIVEWSGTKGRVRIQGEIWKAESTEHYDFKEKEDVLVLSADNLIVTIKPKPNQENEEK